jgi:hypothetical protein
MSLPGITVDVRASTVSVDGPGEYIIRVYDLRGALTYSESGKGYRKYTFATHKTSGVYYIQIHAADMTMVKKIFVL